MAFIAKSDPKLNKISYFSGKVDQSSDVVLDMESFY